MDLFDAPSSLPIQIEPVVSAPLTKDQKAFNNLIRKIEARRALLAEWQAMQPEISQTWARDLLPLQEQCTDLQGELARAYDAAHDRKGTTKGERNKLATLVVELSEAVLEFRADEELKQLFAKYTHSDFDELEAAQLDGMKAMLEDMLGMGLGDDVDMGSPDDILEKVEAQFRAQQESEQESQRASASTRRKSRREEVREAKQEEEQKQLSQSIREVFRKLASALHPDREPDPAERERKTALMQRANTAYEKGNLLQLLELQLELEHIDQKHLSSLSPERLKHYIRILKGQLDDLDAEIRDIEHDIIMDFDLPPFAAIRPKDIHLMLAQDIRNCRKQIEELQQELAVAADAKELKAWLKTLRLSRRRDPDFDLPF